MLDFDKSELNRCLEFNKSSNRQVVKIITVYVYMCVRVILFSIVALDSWTKFNIQQGGILFSFNSALPKQREQRSLSCRGKHKLQ